MEKLNSFFYSRIGDIPYYSFVKKINGNDFRKVFVVDIRNLKHPERIFKNFEEFQKQFLADTFYRMPEGKYPVALSLYFLYDDERLVNCGDVLHDYSYALKDFINYDEYKKLIDEDKDIVVPNRQYIYDYNGKTIKASNFNLVYGPNASGKTMFLRYISDCEKAPLFILNRKFDDDRFLSSSSEYLDNFSHIIEYCREDDAPLLLDDLCWNCFDVRNQAKIVDKLYEFSHDNDVFFTSSQIGVQKLVRSRTHDPNIIEFNR